MRVTTLILITAIMQVSASTYAQKITLSEKNTSLVRIFDKIRNQTGYDFIVTNDVLKETKPVSINVNNEELQTVLEKLFKGQLLNFEIQEKMVVVSKKEPSFLDRVAEAFALIDVRGRVVDENGLPLVGATIAVKGGKGTSTDKDGNFTLLKIDEKAVLVISFIGYLTKEVNANADLSAIALEISNSKLDEIQVIAYGTTTKRFSTSNISSISAETIAKQPVSNPLLALQGRVPGLFIQQASGLSTGQISVTIQGKNSLGKGNVPFYVIDGVPFTPDVIVSQVSNIAAGVPSNLNFINPGDIESIEVLKDADATAIYGSRAANGAILITTKKGKIGGTKVDLNMQTGWSKVGEQPKVLNISQYLEMRREAKRNGNSPISPSDYDINGVWDTTRNVNWQKELLGGTAQYQNLQASVSGGNERTQFLAGMGYQRETTIFAGDFSNIKASVHFNVNHSSVNQKFRFFLSGSYLQGINRLPQHDLTAAANKLSPNAPQLYNDDGTINWEPHPTIPNTSTFVNPVAQLLRHYQDKTNNLTSNSQISYELFPGMAFKSSFGFNRLQADELGTYPNASFTPEERPYIKSFAKFANKHIESWIIEPQLTFNRSYSFGVFDALLGSTFQQTQNYLLGFQGEGYSNDAQLTDLNAAPTKILTGSLQSVYKYNAIFGRINYRYRDRYIVNLTARRDGSSRFGSENLFNNFYSVGGAWIFSEEDFFKSLIPVMNYGKIRVSYGTTGNDQIGDYQFYSLYDNYGVDKPYQGIVGINPRDLSNPYLQWEETRKLNLGIDLGFFNSRILVNANYFRNRSSNQLLAQNLPVITGFGSITRNFPAMVQNTGLELTIDYNPVKGDSFNWSGSVNLTIPKNKLLRYDGLEKSGDANVYVVGESINIKKVYAYAGVNPETGLYQFKTAGGELTSNPNSLTDKTSLVNFDPKWYGGFSNTFSFKGFQLDIFFQFVKQTGQVNRFGVFPGINPNENSLITVLNRWHKPGDIAPVQKVSTNFGELFAPTLAVLESDGAYIDAAYARLKNASISYRFNDELIRKAHIYSARIYLQGENLLTITKYSGGDPETRDLGNLGPLKVITIGTQITF